MATAITQIDPRGKNFFACRSLGLRKRNHILQNHPTNPSTVEQHGLKKIASGKVREIYEVDSKTLLFVATDRISAYDVIMKNVRQHPTSLRCSDSVR